VKIITDEPRWSPYPIAMVSRRAAYYFVPYANEEIDDIERAIRVKVTTRHEISDGIPTAIGDEEITLPAAPKAATPMEITRRSRAW
jgi:hypothetical protein